MTKQNKRKSSSLKGRTGNLAALIRFSVQQILGLLAALPESARLEVLSTANQVYGEISPRPSIEGGSLTQTQGDQKGRDTKPSKLAGWARPGVTDHPSAIWMRQASKEERASDEGRKHSRTLSAALAAVARGKRAGLDINKISKAISSSTDVEVLSHLWVAKPPSSPSDSGAGTSVPEPPVPTDTVDGLASAIADASGAAGRTAPVDATTTTTATSGVREPLVLTTPTFQVDVKKLLGAKLERGRTYRFGDYNIVVRRFRKGRKFQGEGWLDISQFDNLDTSGPQLANSRAVSRFVSGGVGNFTQLQGCTYIQGETIFFVFPRKGWGDSSSSESEDEDVKRKDGDSTTGTGSEPPPKRPKTGDGTDRNQSMGS